MSETARFGPFASPRLTYVALWGLGTALYAGLVVAGYGIPAVAAFLVCGGAAIALHRRSDAPVFDERDREVLDAAGRNTVALVGMTSAVAFPTMVVLEALGYAEWPAWLAYAGVFVAGLFVVWLGFVVYERARRR